MLIFRTKLSRDSAEFKSVSDETVFLPFEIRQKARFVTKANSGKECGIQIERGHILRDGDKLQAEDGTVLEIKAGSETVSTVKETDAKLLARVCYHLGNRHVPLQVEKGWCRFLQDHVLDEMVELLGCSVNHENAPFEPEAGAYSAGGHHHHHDNHRNHHDHHDSGHSHRHSHEHDHHHSHKEGHKHG